MKWFGEKRWVDIETGEALSKSRAERDYLIKKSSTTIQDCGRYYLKITTYECIRNRQQRIEFN